jgi:hypothetical protein
MTSGHLSCPACRIRVRANAPEIALLEDCCPLCGAALGTGLPAAGVIGFRYFDLDELAGQEPDGHADRSGYPVDLVAHREAARIQDAVDTHRWEDDGGSTANGIAVKR